MTDHSGMTERAVLTLCFCWLFLTHALADREGHLAGLFVGVDDDVLAVQYFAVEYLDGERILHQLLDRALQWTRAEGWIVAP